MKGIHNSVVVGHELKFDEYNCFWKGYTIMNIKYIILGLMNITVFERDTQLKLRDYCLKEDEYNCFWKGYTIH